jgi:mono/diheme cytochrome c family protein
MKKIILIASVVLLAGCTSSIVVTPNPAKIATPVMNEAVLAQLNEGKKHFEAHCASCHNLKNPASFTETQWKKLIPEMVLYVNQEEIILNEKAQENILNYLVTASNSDSK